MSLIAQRIERGEQLSALLPEFDAGESAIGLAARMGKFMDEAGNLISEDPSACAWGFSVIIADYLEPYRNSEDGFHLHEVFVALQVVWNTAWRIASPLWQAVVEMVRLEVWTELCSELHALQMATFNTNPLARAHPTVDPPLRSL